MTHSKTMTLDEAVEEALDGKSNVVLCPAHEDAEPSLSVSPGSTQPVVFRCHAGCEAGEIIASGELDWAKVCGPLADGARTGGNDRWTPAGDADQVYAYRDASGLLVFEVLRVSHPKEGGGKRIFQRRPDPRGKYGRSWNLDGVQRVLYRLPQVIEAVRSGHTVHITEGEKCADALLPLLAEGDVSTTNPGGAGPGKWAPEFTDVLAGANVVIYADSDDPGRAHARLVRESLTEAGCTVSVREAPSGVIASTGKVINDVADHIEAGFSLDQLLETTPETEVERAKTGFDLLAVILRPRTQREFVIDGTFAKGERLVLIGFEGTGKAGALDSPLATPTGWTTMGEVQVGEQLIDSAGAPCTVVGKSEVEYPEAGSFRITFSDGSEVVVGGDHQWWTWTIEAREADSRRRRSGRWYPVKHDPEVRTTQQIADTLLTRDGKTNHSVKVCGPLELPEVDLPVAPYTLGVWLGDGDTNGAGISVADRDLRVMDGVTADGYDWRWRAHPANKACGRAGLLRMLPRLRSAGVLGDKHIPAVYLRSSLKQRLDLLAGLMDTDGTCNLSDGEGRGSGAATQELCFTNQRLARGALELILSLGVKATVSDSPAVNVLDGERTVTGTRYRIQFQSDFNPFRHAPFKAERWRPLRTARAQLRFIVSVERVEDTLMQCVQVDSPDHTYLIGEQFIPTHNSTLCRQIAVQVAAGIHPFTGMMMKAGPQRVLYIDGENHPDQTLDSWSQLVGLAAYHGAEIRPGQVTIMEEWAGGRDLTSPDGSAWLHERVHAYRPDLVVMGPATNLADRDLRDDEPVRKIKLAVDHARAICNSAFIIEHHAPLKGTMDKERPMRPYGSSLFLKWPDFGYGIKPTDDPKVFEWHKTRGPRMRKAQWPEALREGQENSVEWPWMPCFLDEKGKVVG